MMRAPRTLSLLAVLLCACTTLAGPGTLDLIPPDAAIGLAVRNLAELKKKGDAFLAAADVPHMPRPLKLFDELFSWQGLKDGVDLEGAAAIMLANPKVFGEELFGEQGNLNFSALTNSIVLVVPFKDRDVMAANFGIGKGALKPDTVVEGNAKNFGKYFYVRGNHVFYGLNEKVVVSVARAKADRPELTAATRETLTRADVLLQMNPKALGPVWKDFIRNTETGLLAQAKGEGEKLGKQIAEALNSVKTSWVTLRVDDGVGLSWVNVFPREGNEAARKILIPLQGGPGTSDLTGLPDGRVIAAQAFHGDGSQNVFLLKVLARAGWHNTVGNNGFLSPLDRAGVIGALGEVYKHLRGSRLAIYHNPDKKKGLCSAVAILDTADADKFLAEVRQMARFADRAGVKLDEKPEHKQDVAAVEKLVRDLGDDSFEVRESASTKLQLIGESGLPYLEKALASKDPEIVQRASDLKADVLKTAAERRKEVLGREGQPYLQPNFAFEAAAEKQEGQSVDVLRLKLGEKDVAVARALREFFGPDWDKVRMVKQGKHMVLLLGSDKDLLGAALKNLKDGSRGLAQSKALSGFRGNANPNHMLEFHASIEAFVRLLTAADLEQPGNMPKLALTSGALTVAPDLLQVDLWMPPSEFKAVETGLHGAK